jgi:hypothetical protein
MDGCHEVALVDPSRSDDHASNGHRGAVEALIVEVSAVLGMYVTAYVPCT